MMSLARVRMTKPIIYQKIWFHTSWITRTHTQTYTLSLYLSISSTHTLTPPHTHSHTHTLTHTHTHSHTLTHTHTHHTRSHTLTHPYNHPSTLFTKWREDLRRRDNLFLDQLQSFQSVGKCNKKSFKINIQN